MFSFDYNSHWADGYAIFFLAACCCIAGWLACHAWLTRRRNPPEPENICHRCGQSVPRDYSVIVHTNSDLRSQGTPLCRSCFHVLNLGRKSASKA